MVSLISELEAQTDTIVNIDSWYLGFKQYVDLNFQEGTERLVSIVDSVATRAFIIAAKYTPIGNKNITIFH